ncbi:MAG: SprT family zinc-dependent metalloprotease [Pseudomonadota bacterium]
MSRLFPPRRRKAAAEPAYIDLSDPPVRVALNVDRRARRFTLRLKNAGHAAVLTLPPGVPTEAARIFLEEHAGWLARALAKQPQRVVVEPGAVLPVDGCDVRVVFDPAAPRAPRLGDACLRLSPGAPAGPRIAAWLKTRCRNRLAPEVAEYAEALGRRVTGLAFRDTRSRWGSCTSAGRISLSWRLAMAPPAVQAYVAAHEAAHLVEMNHSERFWALLAELMPDYAEHRAWLRSEGRALHSYSFEGNAA